MHKMAENGDLSLVSFCPDRMQQGCILSVTRIIDEKRVPVTMMPGIILTSQNDAIF